MLVGGQERLMRNLLSHCVSLLMVALLGSTTATADIYTIVVSGAPTQGLSAKATNGAQYQAVFNASGKITIDTASLDDPNGLTELAITGGNYRFEPSIVTISSSSPDCRIGNSGFVCEVKAIQDGHPSSVVAVTVLDSTNHPISNRQVVIAEAHIPCPKLTDSAGRAIFTVDK